MKNVKKKDLLRVVRNNEGVVFVDETLRANGRGAYLKKDVDVINKAKRNKRLDRRLEVVVPDELDE